jgi:hypothetical protein
MSIQGDKMINLELSKTNALSLLKILNNSLDNYELFTDVDDDNYERFDDEFNINIRKIRDNLRGKLSQSELGQKE